MGIIASNKKDPDALTPGRKKGGPKGPFQLCPQGPQQAVCCDVVDLGWETTMWDGQPRRQHKIRIKWQSAKCMADGRPFLVQKKYTLSLDKKANLTKDLEAWRGRPFTEKEAEAFDLETLIGVNCFIMVTHTQRKNNTYADVMTVMPKPRELPKLAVRDYTRDVDKKAEEAEDAAAPTPPQDDAEVPFEEQAPLEEDEPPPF